MPFLIAHLMFDIRIVVVTCGPPAPIADATANTSAVAYMTKITYTCLPGFVHVSGQLTRQCQADGRWSGKPPSCRGMWYMLPVSSAILPRHAIATYLLLLLIAIIIIITTTSTETVFNQHHHPNQKRKLDTHVY